ncbi:MAG: site-specific integrase [Allosphingosinicella sp.]
MANEKISLMDGRLHVYRRPNSRFWQCSTFLLGRNFRTSTKQDSIPLAKEFAIEWYMEVYAAAKRSERGETVPAPTYLRGGHPDIVDRRRRPVASGPTFKQAAEAFVKEYAISVEGERNANYVAQKSSTIRVHLLPFFGTMALNEITVGVIQDYRVHRQTSRTDRHGEPLRPSRSTIHQEIVCLRQILKTANRKGWLAALPDMSVAYKASGKVTHRAWFSPEEYTRLYEATRERAKNPKKERWRSQCELLHDYVLFMANTGLRPDEAARLEYRDVSIVKDADTKESILEIEVRGKRGVGFCKSTAKAVHPFERLCARAAVKAGKDAPEPTALIFGKVQRELLNTILDELALKFDRDGNVRTAYSLRHTYICMRLNEGADIYQIAKNCRTSVEMIERFYAAHIKNMLNASQINVRRPKGRKGQTAEEASP